MAGALFWSSRAGGGRGLAARRPDTASTRNSTSSSSDRCWLREAPPRIWECPRCWPALSSAPPGTSPGASAKPRITRDLHYFQHPLVVLVLVVAGAHATLSVEAFALAAVFIGVRAIARKTSAPGPGSVSTLPGSSDESLIAAGLIGIAIATRHLPGRTGHPAGGDDCRDSRHRDDRSNMVEAFRPRHGAEASIEPVHAASASSRQSMKRLAGIVLVVAAMVIIREVGPAGAWGKRGNGARARDSRSSPRS